MHRIGRTARAGKTGKAITFVSKEEQHLVRAIESFGRTKLAEDEVPNGQGRDTVKKQLDMEEYADHFGMVPFVINVGKKDGIGMLDLLRFIERKTGIIEHLIGRIEVGEDTSRIEIHKSVAFRAMKGLEQYSFQNKRVRIDLVRNQLMR